jgi:hypothetical protein
MLLALSFSIFVCLKEIMQVGWGALDNKVLTRMFGIKVAEKRSL